MSKMSELSQVLDEMIACGEGMIKAANAIKDIFSSTGSTRTYLHQGRCSCRARF